MDKTKLIIMASIIPIIAATHTAHAIGFSIYTNQSNLLTQFKSYYSNNTSQAILIDDEFNNPPRVYLTYYDQPQSFSRMILSNNITELESQQLSPYINDVPLAQEYNFGSTDYLAYDIEDWTLTPIAQQQNIPYYTQQACLYVHSNGYQFAFTPEIDVPRFINMRAINWTCIDLIDLQEQFLTSDTTAMYNNVTAQLSAITNQNTKVFVQLDITQGLSVTEQDIQLLSQNSRITGIVLQDMGGSTSQLTALVNYIKSFNSPATTTVTTSIITTTSVTSTSTSKSTTSTISSTASTISSTIASTSISSTATATTTSKTTATTSTYTSTTSIKASSTMAAPTSSTISTTSTITSTIVAANYSNSTYNSSQYYIINYVINQVNPDYR